MNVLVFIAAKPCSGAEISQRSGLPAEIVYAELVSLEAAGRIRARVRSNDQRSPWVEWELA